MQDRNIKREELLFKLYLTLSDVRNFMFCSWQKAHVLFNECNDLAKKDEKINPDGKVYYKYLLIATGISETDIHRLAKLERSRKKDFAV